MCGIVGVLAKSKFGLYNQQVNAFQHLLIADQVRGIDGTGVFWHNKLGESRIKKAPTPAINLLGYKDWGKTKSDILFDSKFVVGHNRYSTKGGNSYQNTHPFKEKHITLVHNGTLYSHKHLKDVEVDSHAICHSIAERGVEKTLNDINGAFTLVWYDEEQKKLFFIRNKERPLCLIETEDGWFFASEEDMLTWVLNRNNIKIKSITSDIPIHTLFAYDIETQTLTSEKLEIKPKYQFQQSSKYYPNNSYYDDYYENYSYKDYPKSLPPPKEDKAVILKPNQASKKLEYGKRVEFTPFVVKRINNETYYIEGYKEIDDDNEIQIRFYHKDVDYLESLCIESVLEATVFQEAIISKTNDRYYIVKDVEKISKSANNIPLSVDTIKELPIKCVCCSTLIVKEIPVLKDCHMELTKQDVWQIFCPDCTAHFKAGKKKQSPIIVH